MTNKTFSSIWFHEENKWKEHLAKFIGKPIKALEIGCFEGYSACWLMEHILTNHSSVLHCVDPFGFVKDTSANSEVQHEYEVCSEWMNKINPEMTFFHNTAEYGDRIVYHNEYSDEWFKEYYVLLDFAYVDGSHAATNAIRDMLSCWDMLRVGGVMVVDDLIGLNYCNGPARAWRAFKDLMPSSDYQVLHEGQVGFIEKVL